MKIQAVSFYKYNKISFAANTTATVTDSSFGAIPFEMADTSPNAFKMCWSAIKSKFGELLGGFGKPKRKDSYDDAAFMDELKKHPSNYISPADEVFERSIKQQANSEHTIVPELSSAYKY